MSIRRTSFTALLFSLFVLTAPGMQPGASAAVTCTDADYNGHYAFSSVGSLLVLPPEGALLLGTISQSGRFNPDGKGKVPIETLAIYNGIPTNGYTPGATYQTRPDCTIHFNLTLPVPIPYPSEFEGMLSKGGNQMVLMLTVPSGTEIIGQHIKQDLNFCGVGDFKGAYQLDLTGTVSGTGFYARPAQIAGQYRQLGRLVSDGAGNFTASVFTNYNGRIVPETFSGTYSVNSECFATLTYTSASANQKLVIYGAIGGHGEILMVTVPSEGWGVSGVLRAQQGFGGEQLEIR
ncbi:MAG TPA: hypothetical protein VHC90_23155 [Bryobacteraceae bacterium]|nr:hypothetical protein [Bryobacteraceae bacterium]